MSRSLQTLLIFSCLLFLGNTVKVCKTFKDYYITNSKNCWDNPDSHLNGTQILRRHGCKAEEHVITTEDGYILTLIRGYKNITKETSIVIGHGIYSNSNGWLYRYNQSLVYELVSDGFDVWLINFRGTKYSSHLLLKKINAAFWDFSFHEMAEYDLFSSLRYIHSITNKKSIYIGFSMGSTISYAYSSMYPNEAKANLVGIISLAPIAHIDHTPSVAERGAALWPYVEPYINSVWPGLAVPRLPWFDHFCALSPSTMFFCELFRVTIFGNDFEMLDPETLPIQFYIVLDVVASKVLSHFAQIILSKQFHWFDYGPTKNLEVYGRPEPPFYNTSKISVPVTLIYGENDFLATPQNCKYLHNTLPESVRCGMVGVKWRKWNHIDFIGAKNMSFLYELLLPKIKVLESGKCKDLINK